MDDNRIFDKESPSAVNRERMDSMRARRRESPSPVNRDSPDSVGARPSAVNRIESVRARRRESPSPVNSYSPESVGADEPRRTKRSRREMQEETAPSPYSLNSFGIPRSGTAGEIISSRNLTGEAADNMHHLTGYSKIAIRIDPNRSCSTNQRVVCPSNRNSPSSSPSSHPDSSPLSFGRCKFCSDRPTFQSADNYFGSGLRPRSRSKYATNPISSNLNSPSSHPDSSLFTFGNPTTSTPYSRPDPSRFSFGRCQSGGDRPSFGLGSSDDKYHGSGLPPRSRSKSDVAISCSRTEAANEMLQALCDYSKEVANTCSNMLNNAIPNGQVEVREENVNAFEYLNTDGAGEEQSDSDKELVIKNEHQSEWGNNTEEFVGAGQERVDCVKNGEGYIVQVTCPCGKTYRVYFSGQECYYKLL